MSLARPLPAKALRVARDGLAELEGLIAAQPPDGATAAEIRALFRRHQAVLLDSLAALLAATTEHQEPAEREKHPDGRWVARPGDKVYSRVRGFAGTPASVQGVVEKRRGGLRVQITGTGGTFPGTTKTKSTRYTPEWTVWDDPRPTEQRAERVAHEKAQEAQWKREQEEYEAEARSKAAAAVQAGEQFLTDATPAGRPITDHTNDRRGRIVRQSEHGPIVRWRGELEGDSTVGSSDGQGIWHTITVGSGDAPPDYQLLLQAESHPSFNPTVHVLPHWVSVEDLAEAQKRVASFIEVNQVGEGNWRGGTVMRNGDPYAQVRYDGRIFNSLIGGELDTEGRHIPRRDDSLALRVAGKQRGQISDEPRMVATPRRPDKPLLDERARSILLMLKEAVFPDSEPQQDAMAALTALAGQLSAEVEQEEKAHHDFWGNIQARNKLQARVQKTLLQTGLGDSGSTLPGLVKNRAHIIKRVTEISDRQPNGPLFSLGGTLLNEMRGKKQ